MNPLLDIMTNVMWQCLNQKKKEPVEEEKEEVDSESEVPDLPEESQVADVYENVKYFQKQRKKAISISESHGEKLSFKGKLGGSVKNAVSLLLIYNLHFM